MSELTNSAAGTPGAGYQRLVHRLFLVAAVLMACQYTVFRYGPATVFVMPLGIHGPESIGLEPKAKEGVEPSDVQKPGVFVIDWATWDRVAYRLQKVKSIPPAEMFAALLFLLAAPLAFVLGRRQLWPRWPQWMFIGLAGLSLLGASHFKGGVMEVAQWCLVVLAAYWLAGVALVDAEQVKRLLRWLGWLTLVLIGMAALEYYRYILVPKGAAELPTYVRATCQSRSAYGGLMALLLALAYGRVLAGPRPLARLGWALVCLAGSLTMTAAGAVVAWFVACLAMAAQRGRNAFVATLVLVPLAYLGAANQVSTYHLWHLQRSWAFLSLDERYQPNGVEKRYLELGASLRAFDGQLDREVVGSLKEPGAEEAIVKPIGKRSVAAFGVGPGGNYQHAIGQYYAALDNPKKQEQDTYTLYLMLALQLGVFGALCFAWLWTDGMGIARAAYGALEDPELVAAALGVHGACAAVAVFSVWGTLLVRGPGLLIFVVLALAARLERLSQPAPPSPLTPDVVHVVVADEATSVFDDQAPPDAEAVV